METVSTFLAVTEPATQDLFRILTQYGWAKIDAIVGANHSRTRDQLDASIAKFSSVDVAREVVAGSILQVAYLGIKKFSTAADKSPGALHFEREMNRLHAEAKSPRPMKKPFSLPLPFCVGRSIGDVPIGIIIYAARNQYAHPEEERLSIVNEVVFNYLNAMWPTTSGYPSFDINDDSHFYSHAALSGLGWIDREGKDAYATYKEDMQAMLAGKAFPLVQPDPLRQAP